MKLKALRVLAGALALCACVSVCSVPALAATDTSTFQTVEYSQANTLQIGQRVVITGTPNYSAATSNATCSFFGFDAADGVWYIAIGSTSVAAFQTAVPAQQMTLYGMYAGTLDANGMPILDIQSGALAVGGKLYESADVCAAGTQALAEQQAAEAAAAAEAAKQVQTQQTQAQSSHYSDYVYVTTNGKCYHSSPDCSNMKHPQKVAWSKKGNRKECPKCWPH